MPGRCLPSLKFSERPRNRQHDGGHLDTSAPKLVAPAQNIARAIPLPSVATREGATPIFPATAAASELFDRLGTSIAIPTARAFEATSASTATIAAHFAYLNAICRWLIAQGVSETAARRQVTATFAGLAAQLQGQEEDFATLARDHATPGRDQRTVPRRAGAGRRIRCGGPRPEPDPRTAGTANVGRASARQPRRVGLKPDLQEGL